MGSSFSFCSCYFFEVYSHSSKNSFFNPAAFGVACLLWLAPTSAWVSAGQWGRDYVIVMLLMVLGAVASFRAYQFLTSLSFLAFYSFFLSVLNFYFGYEWSLVGHRMTNGALLLFAFFMISDPKTTPKLWRQRFVFITLTIVLSLVLQYYFYKNNGLIYSLVLVGGGRWLWAMVSSPAMREFLRNDFTLQKRKGERL